MLAYANIVEMTCECWPLPTPGRRGPLWDGLRSGTSGSWQLPGQRATDTGSPARPASRSADSLERLTSGLLTLDLAPALDVRRAATLAAATGASLADLMARMGHASMGAALRYQHATRTQDAVIARALSDLIVRSRAS